MFKSLFRVVVGCLASCAVAVHGQQCNVCTKNGIRMPISLAAGTVRTPEFAGKRKYYNIFLEAKWLIPTEELRCRMGFAVSPSDNHCKLEPLLAIKWKVLDGQKVVAEGIDEGRSTSFEADRDALTRDVGSFRGEGGHRYVVELTFLKDASLLNATQPRLVVEPPGFSF